MKRGSDLTRSLFNWLYVFAFASMITFVEVESVAAQQPSPVPAAVNVKVVNTPEQPVPVTGTVTVGNLGSNPLPVTGPVNVGNSGPLLVQNADNPAIQPVQGFGSCQVVVTRVDCRADLYIVPAGKRLVIEFITIKTVTAGSVETRRYGYLRGRAVQTSAMSLRISRERVKEMYSGVFPARRRMFGSMRIRIRSSQLRVFAGPGSNPWIAA